MTASTAAHVLPFSTASRALPTRVLLADGDDDTRTLYRVSLTRLGFRVRTAASAAEAVDVVRRWRPNVVVTELMLPGGGLSLLDWFLTCEATRHARLVVLTTQSATFLRQRAGDAGADAYLVKPCGGRQLAEAVAPWRARFDG